MHETVRDLSTPILSYMVVLAFFATVYILLTRLNMLEPKLLHLRLELVVGSL